MVRSLAKFSVASKQQSGQRTGAGKMEMAKQRDKEVLLGEPEGMLAVREQLDHLDLLLMREPNEM